LSPAETSYVALSRFETAFDLYMAAVPLLDATFNTNLPVNYPLEYPALHEQWLRVKHGLFRVDARSKEYPAQYDHGQWPHNQFYVGLAKAVINPEYVNFIKWEEVNLIFPDCDVEYYRLSVIAIRLLRKLGDEQPEGRHIPWIGVLGPPGNAPEAPAEWPDLVKLDQGAAWLDFAALAGELRKARKPTQANLVEYMADKKEATVEDVAEHVHADSETDENAVRANANRTNDSLAELGAPLPFRVASGRVFREISPK